MPNLSTYQPPGVYVEDVSEDLSDPIVLGVPENLLCIVAPAQGYQTATENVALYSGQAVTLRHTGVLNDESLVVRTISGSDLSVDVDYTVGAAVDGSGESTTTLLRLPADPATVSPGGVAEGDLVQVSYRYVEADYYLPQTFDDYSLLTNTYGPPLSDVLGDAQPVNSPLTLAAKVAFENGAGSVIALPVQHAADGDWQAEYAAAYDKLTTDHRVSVLVVVFPDDQVTTGTELSNFMLSLRSHCEKAAANGYGRMALATGGVDFDESAFPFENVATTVANRRVVAVYPTRANMLNPSTGQVMEVSGGYLAAALGGRLVYNSVEQSLTRQALASFSSLPASVRQQMTLAFKNTLSSNGVCVVETDRTNRLLCRHGVTTDPSSLVTREISLVRIADVLLQDIQVGMDNSGLIGGPINEDMVATVQGTLMGLLEQEVAEDVILAYGDVTVRQAALPGGDPSVIQCQFTYKPAIPLNYITVQFALDLTTGVVTTEETDAQTGEPLTA